jgi:hypothetical protein
MLVKLLFLLIVIGCAGYGSWLLGKDILEKNYFKVM